MADQTTYSADEITGRTLVAKTPVPLTRSPYDGATTVHTVPAGSVVGVVDSYLMPKPGRSRLWWLFYDTNGTPYFAEHRQGRFSIDDLRNQGAMSVQEQIEQEQNDNETGKQFAERLVKWGVGIFALVYLGKAFIQRNTGK